MPKLVVFDMDGVLFQHHNFWIELHKALGTWEEGKLLTQKYGELRGLCPEIGAILR
ncbi:hypothetical protein HY642_02985 [Candidatus Woesearchaeota archaeon]|nr:hypothetical protein [Candidatus Woesearchaeota archaeon]